MRSFRLFSCVLLLAAACSSGSNTPDDGGMDLPPDLGGDMPVQCNDFPTAPAPSGSCAANVGVEPHTLASATTSCIALATGTGDTTLCARINSAGNSRPSFSATVISDSPLPRIT
jgi:hypothetical protein